MGREVRRVPKDWVHPTEKKPDWSTGRMVESPVPMFDQPFGPAMREWIAEWEAWERGERPDYCEGKNRDLQYWEWADGPPDPKHYRPDWPDEIRTHLMMYEDTSEGTPISPAFETPEELARWCADNYASWFGDQGADYDSWLAIAKGGWRTYMVVTAGVVAVGEPIEAK